MFPLSAYTQEQKEVLRFLGFHWKENEKEWFNDKNYSGRGNDAVYLEFEINYYVLALRITNDEGKETYETFMNITDLKEYLK